MFREITWVHGRLVTRITKKHRSPKWIPLLPEGVFILDRPRGRRKIKKQRLRLLLPNDGLHVHGLLAVKHVGRLKDALDKHFEDNKDRYLIQHIEEIDIELVTHRPAHTTEYGAKALKRRDFSSDDILVLPRSQTELKRNPPRSVDPIKDIQAATNFSVEESERIARDPRLIRQILGKRYDVDHLRILPRTVAK